MSDTTAPAPMPVGGDPSKPGAWTPAQIDAWSAAKACADAGHPPFWATDPKPWEDVCPGCRTIARHLPTSAEGWADHWAEERKENGGHGLPFRRR